MRGFTLVIIRGARAAHDDTWMLQRSSAIMQDCRGQRGAADIAETDHLDMQFALAPESGYIRVIHATRIVVTQSSFNNSRITLLCICSRHTLQEEVAGISPRDSYPRLRVLLSGWVSLNGRPTNSVERQQSCRSTSLDKPNE